MTDDPETYEKLLAIRNLNFTERKRYIHSEAGWNFRLNNLSCSIGLGQIENIDKTIKDRKRIAKRYNDNFKSCTEIQIPYQADGFSNVYWYYAVVIKNTKYDKLLKALDDNGIDYRHFFNPLHKQPFNNSEERLPVSEHLYNKGLILPTYTGLKNKDIDFICKVVLDTVS